MVEGPRPSFVGRRSLGSAIVSGAEVNVAYRRDVDRLVAEKSRAFAASVGSEEGRGKPGALTSGDPQRTRCQPLPVL